ncbi:MAG: TolC family protein, partial [Pirellulales bacterium]|nr:TolC family protein [Pirellulales bacterium]
MTILMVLRLLAIALLLPLGGMLSGCACPSSKCGVPGTPCAPCIYERVEPEDTPPDLMISGENQLVPLPAPTETYQLLEAATCQCNAATNASVANMVELERHWAKVIIECDTKAVRENLCLDRDLLSLRANDLRNQAAASALTAFYQLAGLEAQKHYLYAGLEESQKTLERIDKIKAEGLEIPNGIERSEVVAKISQLEDQTLQIDLLRVQLNGQLQTLIGCPLNETSFYWPQVDWQPDLTPLDVEGELLSGLSTRIDLRGLSLVLCKLHKTTLPIARGVLKFSDSTVGSVEPREGWIHVARCFRCNETEVPIRCRQLALFYDHTERGATVEIKGVVYKIGLVQQQIVLAQQAVEALQDRLDELIKKRDVEDVTVFEISKIRGRLYEAQAELIEQVVALKIARVQLREAQNVLPIECGFNPHLCCEGCCDGDCCQCST